ncbi:MAG: hypothetical protein ACP5O7_03825 [Phycisphaerae bacterium]
MKNMRQWMARADEQWGLLAELMPDGWESKARELGALRRTRSVKNPSALLRMLLLHLADGCSLRESATRITLAGWGQVSAVAVFKRLRASERWLAWLAQASWNREVPSSSGRRFLAVDASTVCEQGETGSQWRVHWCVDLSSLSCTHFELTDVHGGEKFARFPIRAGDIIMGDRGYSTPTGVESVTSRGGEVLIRLNPMALPLYDKKNGTRMNVFKQIRVLKVGQCAEWTTWVKGPNQWYQGRLLAVKRSRASTLRACK